MADFPNVIEGDAYLVGDGPDSKCIIANLTTQPVGFHGTTPVIQAADAGQGDQGTMTTVGANTGTAGTGLTVIGDTTSVDQASNLMDDFVALQEDIASLDVLVTEMRTVLVNVGLMKGGA